MELTNKMRWKYCPSCGCEHYIRANECIGPQGFQVCSRCLLYGRHVRLVVRSQVRDHVLWTARKTLGHADYRRSWFYRSTLESQK